jgi:ribosomal protein S18 acetylase RimI-like enzyme
VPDPTFRQATPADGDAVARVGTAVWEELAQLSGLTGPLTADGVRARLSEWGHRGAMFLCEESSGKACGFAILQPDVSHPTEAVLGVWLLSEARGKGIGRDLAAMGTEFARDAGYKRLRGIIPDGNEPALSFFGDFAQMAQMVGQGMEYELPL